MLFNSLEFGVFFLLTFWAWGLATGRGRHLVLLAASYLFYASWNPWFLLLLGYSTVLDFYLGRALGAAEGPRKRKLLLLLSVFGNLSVLAYFKYGSFLLVSLGLRDDVVASQTFLVVGAIPPGLSFYTFQSLGYTIDVYRREAPVCRNLTDFALYVAFFPQLIAGPISRSYEFLPQLRLQRRPDRAQQLQGVELFVVGLLKKCVIADNLGLAVDRVFAAPSQYQGLSVLLGAALFGFQIYCDFSAYSTMARGLAKLFGLELARNFDYPALASNPLDYYRRWHITMSNWFRDYVFVPLSGKGDNRLRVALSLIAVWALFGLWHGASWTFVLWGLYNGVLLLVYRMIVQSGPSLPHFPGRRLAGLVLTWLALVPPAVLFRSSDTREAFSALAQVLTLDPGGKSVPLWWWSIPPVAILVLAFCRRYYYDEELLARLSWPGRVVVLAAATLLLTLASPERRPFIYLQF